MKKNCCGVHYKWLIIQNHTGSIRLVKLCYQKNLEHATGIDTSNLAAKKDFIALKAEADK